MSSASRVASLGEAAQCSIHAAHFAPLLTGQDAGVPPLDQQTLRIDHALAELRSRNKEDSQACAT